MKKPKALSLSPPPADPKQIEALLDLNSFPSGVPEEPRERRKTDPGAPLPWNNDEYLPDLPKGQNLMLHPELYAKMKWLTRNVPQLSLQKIIKVGTETEVQRLLDEHYYKRS
jgi:hypothetical protein